MAENARDLVTRWHEGWGIVSDKTKVYVVPDSVDEIKHTCPGKSGSVAEAISMHVTTTKQFKLVMYQPTHHSRKLTYCSGCDTLFVAEQKEEKEPNNGE